MIIRNIIVLSVCVTAANAIAGAPDLQDSSGALFNNSVVRVLSGTSFNGTGTIIDHKNINGQGWLCVLTADHVVSQTGTAAGATIGNLGIAFGNSPTGTGDSAQFGAAGFVARKAGASVDLAVLGIHYGAFNPLLTMLKREMIPGQREFSVVGYGASGVYMPGPGGGYVRTPGTYGVQRYVNNDFNNMTLNQATFGGYVNDTINWDVDAPGAPTSVLGEGTTFDGDSGSPYFFSSPIMDMRFDPPRPLYTNKIIGVHSFGFSQPYLGGPATWKPWGTMNGGVYLQRYIPWIEQQCQAVPEPATLAAIGMGVVAMLRRRRRSA